METKEIVKYSDTVKNKVQAKVSEIWGYDLNDNQIRFLINKQPKEIVDKLTKVKTLNTGINLLIDNISEKITGYKYPKNTDDDVHRKRFFVKLHIKSPKYFEPVIKARNMNRLAN